MYWFRCIIPSDKWLRFEEDSFIVSVNLRPDELIEEEARRLEERKISVDGEMLTLTELSNTLNFTYCTRLVFMAETDYRTMPSCWGLPQFGDAVHEAVSATAIELNIVDELEGGHICPDIEVKFISDKIGHGLFATKSLSQGAFIGEYTGIVICTQKPGPYSLNYPCLDGGHEINAFDTGNVIRFINHSENSNASFHHIHHCSVIHAVCMLQSPVEAGEQISVNYGKSYWKQRGTPDSL